MVNMDALGVLELAEEEAEEDGIGQFADFVLILLQSTLAEDFDRSGKWAAIFFEISSHVS